MLSQHWNKRAKFKRIMDSLEHFEFSNAFLSMKGEKAKNVQTSIIRNLEGEQKETYKRLWDLKVMKHYHDHKDFVCNSEVYEEAIQSSLNLIRQLLTDYVGEPIQFPNGYGYDTIDEFFGSKFKCVYDGHIIEKIDKVYDEDGYSKNHLYGMMCVYPIDALPEWIQEMSTGLYSIDNVRFDIWSYGEIKWTYDEVCEHPLQKYINKYRVEEENDEVDHECSRCRGGGCPSCDTSGFFTGFKIYD
jgi:hypothetical protein